MTPAELHRRVASASSKEIIENLVNELFSQRGIVGERPWDKLAVSLAATANSDCVLALIAAELKARKFDESAKLKTQ